MYGKVISVEFPTCNRVPHCPSPENEKEESNVIQKLWACICVQTSCSDAQGLSSLGSSGIVLKLWQLCCASISYGLVSTSAADHKITLSMSV